MTPSSGALTAHVGAPPPGRGDFADRLRARSGRRVPGSPIVCLGVALGLSSLPTPAGAQLGAGRTAFPGDPLTELRDVARSPMSPTSEGASPALATGLSALLPGAGQHLLGQRRKWLYLAIEAVGWAAWIDRRGAGGDFRVQYRDLAWEEARIQSGSRVDGAWAYYETLTKWERSGLFDVDPGAAGVQPEEDPTTYNGSIWTRAVGLFLPGGAGTPVDDPGYQRALAYYDEHAYGTTFLWDWSDTGDAQTRYSDLIGESDRRFRQATNVMGAIIANHVISAADAYLSARGVPTPSSVRLLPERGWGGVRWHAVVRVGAGR